MRPEKYREADLRTDDQIMMFNGMRIKTVDIFDSIYSSLKIGDEIKLGVKRGDMLVMIKFPKADPEEMPVQRVMMVADGEAAGDDGELPAGGIYKFSGDSENECFLPEIGLVFEEKDGHAVIKSVLPEAVKFFKDDVPQKGYVLMEINNTKFSTVKELADIYETVKVGEPVSLKYVYDGYMITTSFAKPKPERDVIIKTKVKE